MPPKRSSTRLAQAIEEEKAKLEQTKAEVAARLIKSPSGSVQNCTPEKDVIPSTNGSPFGISYMEGSNLSPKKSPLLVPNNRKENYDVSSFTILHETQSTPTKSENEFSKSSTPVSSTVQTYTPYSAGMSNSHLIYIISGCIVSFLLIGALLMNNDMPVSQYVLVVLVISITGYVIYGIFTHYQRYRVT